MPGWYARYRILVWMCVLIGVNQLGFGSVVPVAPLYAASFGVSPSAIGLTIALYGLARLLPAGAGDHRRRVRRGISAGVAGSLLATSALLFLRFAPEGYRPRHGLG